MKNGIAEQDEYVCVCVFARYLPIRVACDAYINTNKCQRARRIFNYANATPLDRNGLIN